MDLTGLNSKQLRQLLVDVDRELARRRRTEIKAAQKEARSVASRYGLRLDEVLARDARSGRARGITVLRHPEDPELTWAGRGRKPAWVRKWEAAGRSLDELPRASDAEPSSATARG